MTADLRELYQSVILDHYKHPHNCHPIKDANRHAEGYNPLCGDRVEVYLILDDAGVRDIGFVGSGCAICTASASMMTDYLKGKSREEAEDLFRRFHDMLTGVKESQSLAIGKLEAFSGVREFPIRVKCATLPWHVFRAALHGEATTVSTE